MIQVLKEYSYGDFWELYNNSWSGARDTLDTIKELDKEDNLMEFLEGMFYEPITETELNDFLWFDRDYIYEELGIDYE